MRELARVAAARGLPQEQLAREFAKAFEGRKINGGNVTRHFASRVPQRDTIEVYRAILGMHRDHLRLVDPRPLSAEEMHSWRKHLVSNLNLRLASAGVRKLAIDALDRRLVVDRERALRDYALAEMRDSFGAADAGEFGLSPALTALRPHLLPDVDLATGVRRPDQRADFLASIWTRARSVKLSDAHVDALVMIARSFAIEDGLDPSAMDSRLEDARSKIAVPSYFAARARLQSPATENSNTAQRSKKGSSK